MRGSWPSFSGFTESLLFFGLGGFSFTFDAFMRSGDVHCVWLWRGSGCCGVARCRAGGCPAITFGRGAGVRIWVRSVMISLFYGNFAFFRSR